MTSVPLHFLSLSQFCYRYNCSSVLDGFYAPCSRNNACHIRFSSLNRYVDGAPLLMIKNESGLKLRKIYLDQVPGQLMVKWRWKKVGGEVEKKSFKNISPHIGTQIYLLFRIRLWLWILVAIFVVRWEREKLLPTHFFFLLQRNLEEEPVSSELSMDHIKTYKYR